MINNNTRIVIFILCLFLMNFQSTAEENEFPFPPQLDSLINIQNKFGNDTDKVKLLNEIAWHYVVVNADSGLQYGYDALKLAISLGWEKGAADAYNNIGESLRFKGEIEKSLSNHKTALDIFESIDDKHGIAHSLSQIGISYFNLSDLSISYQYFYKALSLYRELNEKDGIAKNLSYMGIIQSNLKEYELALEHFNNSKNIYKELNEQQKFAVQTANIGLVYYDLKEYNKALEFYEQALNLFDEVGDFFSKSIFLSNAGLVYTALSDYEKAELSFSEALKISTQLDDKEGIAYQYGNIGKLYLKKAEDKVLNQSGQITNGLISRSIEYLEKSIVLLTSLGENIERKEFLFSLSQAYKLKNNFQKAFEIFAEATQIKDSILTSESKKQIAELEIKQQLDLRDKELELLNAKNNYQKKITYLLLGFIGLIAFSAVIIFILYMRIKNDNLALNENIRIRKEVEESLRLNESELKKYHEHLEELVNERTEELKKEITERIDIENSLRKSQERYDLAVEGAELGTWDWDIPSGKVIYGGKYLEMLGYSQEEYKPTLDSWENAIHPDDRNYVLSNLQDHLDGKTELYKTEHRLKTKEGDWKWILDVGKIVEIDSEGKPLRAAGIHYDITERKTIDQAIKESEVRFRSIFDNVINIAVQGYLEDGTVHYWNKASETLYGYTSEEAFGNRLYDLIIPTEAVEAVKEAVKNMFETEISIPSEELLLKKKDGSLVHVYSNHTIINIPGKRKEMYCIDVDLTELKRAENELREKSDFIQTVLENLPIGIALNKIDEGTAFYINKKFEETYGWSASKINNVTTFFDKIYPDPEYRESIIQKILADINSGDVNRMIWNNIEIVTESGEKRIVNAQNIPLLQQNTMVSTVLDVTAEKKSELLLRESEEKFRNLFETMPSGYYRSTPEGYYIDANPAFIKMLGYESLEELKSLYIPTDVYVNPHERVELTKSNPGFIEREETYRLKRKDGSVIWLEEFSRFIKDKNGNVIYNEGLCKDITDRKLAEEKLIESEEQKSKILSSTLSGLYIYNAQIRKYDYINSAHSKITGWSIAELNEMDGKFLDLFHPEDKSRVTDHFQAIVDSSTDNTVLIEYRFKTKENKWIWLLSYDRVFERDEKGNVKKIIGSFVDNTKQKEIQNALRESEQKYRDLFEKSKDANLIIQDGVFVNCNKAMVDLLGCRDKDEIINKKPSQFSPDIQPDGSLSFEKEIDIINIALEYGSHRFEWYHKRVNEQVFPVEVLLTTIKTSGNEVIHGVVRDITESKRAEEALRESEELHRKLLMTVPDLIIRTNLQGDIIFVNEFTFNKIRFNPKENLLGKNMLSFVAEKDLQRAIENTKLMFEKPLGVKEYLLSFEDKIEIECEVNGDIIIDADNKPIGMVYVIRDITERKQAEAALRESEERFSKAFKSSPAPLVISEIETGKFIDVNERWIQMLGYSLEENLGHTSKEHGIWDDPKDLDKAIELIKKDGHFKDLPIKFVTKSGEKRDAFWSAEIIFLHGKEVMLSSIYDYTEQKIIQEALLESQRLSAVGEMSSAIAHDFNNSLQSISGNLELAILKMENRHPLRKYLETIKKVVSDAAVRVQLLQRFAGKSKSRYEYIHVDLNQVVKDVIVQTRPLWKDSVQKEGMVIRFETSYTDIPGILGNEGELRSAVYNLIKNSIEAMPSGGVIKIKTSCKDNNVYLNCIDTGTGMDEETKSRVFQPFFSTKGFETGRGMGMVNAYSIIKEHGGKLEIIKSQPGKGTEIQIILPVSDIQEKAQVIEHKDSNVELTANILWVDDDNLIREVAAEMLEVLGHNGDVVGSGEEALIKLNENNYDLVVTDIGMPGMNGWELADKIKELYKGEIKVAVLTGWGDQIDDDEKQRHGVSFIIGKPFKIEQIERLITEAVILGKDDR